MENSHIQWTHHTFNPWIGCTKVAPECKFCYAEEQQDHRYGRVKWGKGQPRSRTSEDYWKQPAKWDKEAEQSGIRRRVFCASLADVFDDEVSSYWRNDLFHEIRCTPHLDWLLLTKRPHNVTAMLAQPPANVWLGVSAGVDPKPLLEVPATIHFLSCEPMLHKLDDEQAHITQKFDWIIFGGESGKQARRCEPDWIRHGLEFCDFYSIAPFVKQLGSNCGLRLKHPKGGDMGEWPKELRVREFPEIRLSPDVAASNGLEFQEGKKEL